MTDNTQIKKFFQESIKSDLFLAALVLALTSVLLQLWSHINREAPKLTFDVPYRSRAWWTVKDFLAQSQTADLVLLGASDLTCALYSGEATALRQPQNQMLRHKSTFLEHELQKGKCPIATNFCLGIPGEMPSDAFLLANTLLVKQRPKVIFYTVTPRSFFDATFGDPASTDIYKVLSKSEDTHDVDLQCHNSLWGKLDYLCGRLLWPYEHKWDLVSWQHLSSRPLFDAKILPDFSVISTPAPIRKICRLELPEDFAPNELIERPYDPKHVWFIDNLKEYRARYCAFKRETYKQQFDYFQKLCELCQAEGIDLIVANSPVTDENRKLIPASIYKKYLKTVRETAQRFEAAFVDFDSLNLFNHEDFFDSVHLNGRGGIKYLKQIASVLAHCEQLKVARQSNAPHLALIKGKQSVATRLRTCQM